MSSPRYPSVEFVRQSLSYADGKLFWKPRDRSQFPTQRAFASWNARYAEQEAGCQGSQDPPRWQLTISGVVIRRNLLVWAIHHGEWPGFLLDHENRNSLDDRIENLRPSDHSLNGANSNLRKLNTSGFKGVYFNRHADKYAAQISVRGKMYGLGLFSSPVDAHAAYMQAARTHFGKFAHDGS